MEILQEIKKSFAYFRTSNKGSLALKEDYYWVVKMENMQGVAVEIPADKQVNEQFANMYYCTKDYLIGNNEHRLLMLLSDQPGLFEEFTYICVSFLEKVLDSESHQEILENPISWWHTMKELVGNTNIEQQSYSILAEMLSYFFLLKSGYKVSWVGPFGGSIDLESTDGNYEVKSTTARYGSKVTINGQYQLRADNLLFCRFEPSLYGISIQDMVEKLIGLNVKESDIELVLTKCGYPIGSEIRSKKYRLIQMVKYEINENFPRIVPESFKNDQLPMNISELNYKVNLEGVIGKVIEFQSFFD